MANEHHNLIGSDRKVTISAESVSLALSRILASTPFHSSKQSQDLLRYLVEKALIDHDEALKERTIGIEVFGRKPNYNTSDDPIVRSRAGEVRKRLAQYYQSEAGHDCDIRIALQPFSYRPIFTAVHETSPEIRSPELEIAVPEVSHESNGADHEHDPAEHPRSAHWSGIPRWGRIATAALVLLAIAGIALFYRPRNQLDLFWAPILKSKKPVLILTGTNSVYYPVHYPDSEFFRDNLVAPGGQLSGLRGELPPLADGQSLTGKEIEPNNDDYVQGEDIASNVDVTSLLTAHHRGFILRAGSDVSVEDFYNSPTILIGNFSNPSWAMKLTGDLSFIFDRNRNIRERGGQNRSWLAVRSSDRSEQDKVLEDYAIVSRLLDQKTGNMMITISGLTTCGTRAAADWVVDPSQLDKIKDIPARSLENSNIQIVLHSTFVKCVPVSTDVVALKYW